MSKYKKLTKIARKALLNDEYETAIVNYETAFEEYSLLNDVVDYGISQHKNNSLLKAYEIFTDITIKIPSYAYAYFALAMVCEDLGKTSEAIVNYELAIKYQPDFKEAYFNLGCLYDRLEKFDESIKNYEKTLEYDNEHFWAHLNLGAHLEKQEEDEQALEHMLKALEINRYKKMVNYNLGVIYTKLKQYDKALHHYLKELKCEEDAYYMVYLNIALLYKDIYKDYDKAMHYYLKGIASNKEDYVLWYNLGCLYVVLKQEEDAYKCFYYSCSKDETLLDFMKQDEELLEFRTSDIYKKLLEKIEI